MTATTLRTRLSLTLVALSFPLAGCSAAGPTESAQTEGAVEDSESALSTSANEKTAYDFFVNKGLRNFQAAAIVGNLQQESGVDPTIAQYGGGPGRGIAQWSAGGRWNADAHDNMVWYAQQRGQSAYSLEAQLEFVWYELTSFPSYGLSELRASTTLTSAVIAFQDRFEGCGACAQGNRVTYAQAVLNAYGKGGGGGVPTGGQGGGAGCYSSTLGREEPANACVQSRSNGLWYQCDDGAWVDRWNDPTPCNGVHPL